MKLLSNRSPCPDFDHSLKLPKRDVGRRTIPAKDTIERSVRFFPIANCRVWLRIAASVDAGLITSGLNTLLGARHIDYSHTVCTTSLSSPCDSTVSAPWLTSFSLCYEFRTLYGNDLAWIPVGAFRGLGELHTL